MEGMGPRRVERMHNKLSIGDVLTAEYLALTVADAADEAHWDMQFAKSQRFLEQLADEAARERSLGRTEDLDPTRW